ncbi:ankyrin repeat-containing domain protein [Thelonectria olida]|uniref:Ankyrin repeat-containing domain protein n=1 Tax=Thelonectria olida TaxID=1576542 RepID=A0A9P8VY07_9HYPO|nr:ankyrin repeat-containing domain protein [Thelonectria olida]
MRYDASFGSKPYPWILLFRCARKGELDMLRLLTHGQPVQPLDRIGIGEMGDGTALYQACLAGHFKCARHLMRQGSSLGIRCDPKGLSSMLHAGAIGGSTKIIQCLLQNYAFDINEMDDNCLTPLALACSKGNRRAATILVQKGADPTVRCLSQGCSRFSALYWCADSLLSSTKTASLLLRYQGATWKFSQEDLDVALARSVEEGCEGMFKLLLDNGADPNFPRESDNWTCLHLAAAEGHVQILELLLRDARTNILHTDFTGQTALHVACGMGLVSTIVPFILGPPQQMQAIPPGAMDKLLCAKDIFDLRALDYRLLPSRDQALESVEKNDRDVFLVVLREYLNPLMRYVDGDLKYMVIGDSLVCLGDDDNAVKAYQMNLKWVQCGNEFICYHECKCDRCGSYRMTNSSRLVCRTCIYVNLCERCHTLYQQPLFSGDLCAGHDFLRVPAVSLEELHDNWSLPEGGDHELHWRFARTAEMASPWMDELRAKYSVADVNPTDTVSGHPEIEPGASFFPHIARDMIQSGMYTANLKFTVLIANDAPILLQSVERGEGNQSSAEFAVD